VTNERRLSIALENLLREMGPDELKALCSDKVDELRRTLPKERGGTKVPMSGTARGRATASAGGKKPGKAIGSLGVREGTPNTPKPHQPTHRNHT